MHSTALNLGRGVTPRSQNDSVPESLLQRIRSEFIEMPGLRLTLSQAQRLWGLDARTCEASLRRLVDAKFLTADGVQYARLSDSDITRVPATRMAKAALDPRVARTESRSARGETAAVRFEATAALGIAAWQSEVGLALAARSNLLLCGHDASVAGVIETIRSSLAGPLTAWRPGAPFVLPTPDTGGTLLLYDVRSLSKRDQHRLVEWTATTARGAIPIISTTAVALFPDVASGTFLEELYYRLNTVMVDLAAR